MSFVPGENVLPEGVRSRFADGVNGLRMHFLEAGIDDGRPCVLLLHGFPELAFSWRKVMVPIANKGFYVVAPDQRGYGGTSGWDPRYNGDLESFRLLNLIKDVLGLLRFLGRDSVHAVVGHDFGSMVASFATLARPDVFRSLVLMSAPFGGPPAIAGEKASPDPIHDDLKSLDPPRKHYQWHYSTPEAEAGMTKCAQGLHDFLRAYFHMKSADWKQNQPFLLAGWTATELAKLPTYYVMEHNKDMAETVASEMPSADEIVSAAWLPEEVLCVYSETFTRTGLQGGLQWYRCMTNGTNAADLGLFTGYAIQPRACFIAGQNDWGIHQKPGELSRMENEACANYEGTRLIDDAGHWVQQEQPSEVVRLIGEFLK